MGLSKREISSGIIRPLPTLLLFHLMERLVCVHRTAVSFPIELRTGSCCFCLSFCLLVDCESFHVIRTQPEAVCTAYRSARLSEIQVGRCGFELLTTLARVGATHDCVLRRYTSLSVYLLTCFLCVNVAVPWNTGTLEDMAIRQSGLYYLDMNKRGKGGRQK